MNLDGISFALLGLILILGVVVGAFFVIWFQRKKGSSISRDEEVEDFRKVAAENRKLETLNANAEKIKDFMQFDSVEDDMIIQDNCTRFCMVIRCMGINYDLMSENEMLAVEEGFSNFLNTLKFPIQLYVQSRTLDLSEGISRYRTRLASLKDEADRYISSATRAQRANPNMPLEQQQAMDYEIKKRRNLLDYGNDIINYVERMSSNRNILQRKYYMICSYDTMEMGFTSGYTEEDIKDMAYSELFTRCKTLQSAIAACGIETEMLRTEDLAELLFIAYNKDDAASFNIKEAMHDGVFRLCSTADSVKDKKRYAKEQKLKEEGFIEAQDALRQAMNKLKSVTYDINDLTEEKQAAPVATPEEKPQEEIAEAPVEKIDDTVEQENTTPVISTGDEELDAFVDELNTMDPDSLLNDIIG